MSNYFFIVNPIAGSGNAMRMFETARSIMDDKGISYSFAISQYPKHAVELTRTAVSNGESMIVAVGGDGTVNEVASELNGRDVTMGIFPGGTGNDLAFALNIPPDAKHAMDVLLNGNVRKMDAGTANDSFFINVAGLGFDVDVLKNTEGFKKKLNGMLPYLLGIIKTLLHLSYIDLEIETNGEKQHMPALLVAVANGKLFGGGMKVAPMSDPFDGLFDVCLVERLGLLKFLQLLPRFIKGRHIGLKPVKYFHTNEIKVVSKTPCTVQIDGELICQTPVSFRILPGAISIMTPAN